MTKRRECILECQGLSKVYPDVNAPIEVLQNVDFKVCRGDRIAVIGASGSGKTTFLQLLGGLDAPTAGKVLIAGHDIHQMKEQQKGKWRNKNLGFIYQFHHLLPDFNALENVAMPLLIAGVAIPEAKERAFALLKRVGLEQRTEHRVSELSGGERQRVAIVRALANHPACVLADEPTGNLDDETAEAIFQLLLELNQELQISLVIVTHNTQFAKRMERIYCLQHKRLVDETPPIA